MNFLPVGIGRAGPGRRLLRWRRRELQTPVSRRRAAGGQPMRWGMRAEAMRLDSQGACRGKVEVVERLGDRTHLHVAGCRRIRH
jgi:multiple sugar transport system ATP-binding protein